ncbi:sensor histidine kinase [Paenibacillus methanolicus]|nr:histidine kinase N-terminal 7TM domain-containing protein [Paenibacillus methanolicus]
MAILLFLAAGAMAYVAFLSYQQRHMPVARTMMLIMIGAAFYASGYAFEVLSDNLREMKLALQIEYVGIPFVSTLWFFQVIQFTGTAAGYRKRLAVVLFAIPAAVFILHLTNEAHHLVYERYLLNEDARVPLYTTIKGTWYRIHTLYNYLVILSGFLLFIPMYWRSSRVVRKQIVVLVMGAAVPMLFNSLFWFGVTVDLTPFGFAVSGIVYAWGILRFNLLRFTPLALTQVFDTIRDGVILLDYKDQIVSYNAAAEGVFPELGLTKHYPADVGGVLSGSPEVVERVRAAVIGDERFPFRRAQASRSKHYHCSLSFIYDSGTPIGKMLLLSDITELKENEVRLQTSARQLSELNAFKDKLFTVVAHDIRDPIANLVSLTELLGEELEASGVEHAEVFHGLQGQVQNTFQLVENLLDWYRNQNGRIVFRPLGWNLRQVVRQSISLAGHKAGMKQITLTERIGENIMVRADKEMLDLILRNLLSNAIKHTGTGGTIEIGAVSEGELVVVSVRDNGSGIEESTAAAIRLDGPFASMPAAGDDTGSARFGLVLANEFARIHGGSLWFDSVPGRGTTFSFTLPRSSGDGDASGDVGGGDGG